MVYLCKLSSSLGKCYWLFPNHYTGTEKTFILTWQNLSRRRQWVLHSWLGTMRLAQTTSSFTRGGKKQEIIDDALLMMDTGYRSSSVLIKLSLCILLLTTAHLIFWRNKKTKTLSVPLLLQGSYFLLIRSVKSMVALWVPKGLKQTALG